MQLSTRGRYAVMAMTELAGREGARAVSPGLHRRAPADFAALSRAAFRPPAPPRPGAVGARPGGGYRLARPAGELSVAEVVIAVDEPLRATRCSGAGAGCMKGGARCLTHDLWDETGRQIHDYLAAVSLADVLAGRLRPGEARAA